MSFDIFMNPYLNGKPAPFDRSLIREAFGAEACSGADEIWNISYPDQSGGQVYGADEETVESLMFNHCGGDRFYEGLLRLAERTNSIIFWPTPESMAVVTSEKVRTHIDPEMLAAFSRVEVVNGIDDLGRYLSES